MTTIHVTDIDPEAGASPRFSTSSIRDWVSRLLAPTAALARAASVSPIWRLWRADGQADARERTAAGRASQGRARSEAPHFRPIVEPPMLPRAIHETDTHITIAIDVPKEFVRQNIALMAYLVAATEGTIVSN